MYSHTASTLLGSKRRSVYYPPTGTGRDTYIMIDNGGTNSKYTCQGVPQLGNYMKFGPINRPYKPTSYTKFQKYTSDGSGRDKYVVSKHGGQYLEQDQMNLKLLKFRNTMRNGGEWRKEKTMNQTQNSWRSMSVMRKEDEMRKTQRSVSNRLSAPKRVTQKYEQKLNLIRTNLYSSDKKSLYIDTNNEEVQA